MPLLAPTSRTPNGETLTVDSWACHELTLVCSPPWGTAETLWVQVQTADTRLSGHLSHTPTQRSCESLAVGQSSVSCTHWVILTDVGPYRYLYLYQCESQAVDRTSMTAAPCSSNADMAITQITKPQAQVPPNTCLFRVLSNTAGKKKELAKWRRQSKCPKFKIFHSDMQIVYRILTMGQYIQFLNHLGQSNQWFICGLIRSTTMIVYGHTTHTSRCIKMVRDSWLPDGNLSGRLLCLGGSAHSCVRSCLSIQ